MSRRLGDDPLTRARSERAKATAEASIAVGSEGQEGTTQVGSQSASRASYNDVFFRRRGGDAATQSVASAPLAEAPEISEISQIPEIREAAAASASATTLEPTADLGPTSLEAQAPQDAPEPTVPLVDRVSAEPDGRETSTASPAVTLPQTKEERILPITFQNPTRGGEGSSSEQPKSGGFFKRLFGKFK